ADPVVQALAQTPRMLRDMVLQGAALDQADEIAMRDVRQAKAAPVGKRMTAGDDQGQRIGPEEEAFQSRQIGAVGYDSDVSEAAAQGIGNLIAQPLFEID